MQEKQRTGRLMVTTDIDGFWAINIEKKELDYLTREMERRLSDEIFGALMSLRSEVIITPIMRFSRENSECGGRTIGLRTEIFLTDWRVASVGDYVADAAISPWSTGDPRDLIIPFGYGAMEFQKDSLGWRRVS